MIWSVALWHLIGALTDVSPAGLVVGALLVAVLAAVAAATHRSPVGAPQVTPGVLRQRAARILPRHRDPDAAGRTRPRGPTRRLAPAR
ncbi:DUF6412 domain-containing protein [Paractinoplanes atraurantiacus]|uniref:Uncharacterized protein n=1 Tax=Paractinoplanes atraurantiacus TaxID=1036182 RepID=A0A285KQ37_9ACTN|nr:DUF6412 domain-containing protein [Actinoplanes atraurantiacus]SNY74735.1 hypothetical protein SAMN05421748_1534 [Actinoplanes atraurantiacus]